MTKRAGQTSLMEAAARFRIDQLLAERRDSMTTRSDTYARPVDLRAKEATRAMWALGDYHRFAKETVWGLGPELVRACGIVAGQRVLDVAAGSGNVAIRAAQAGADVVASDLTPENLEAGSREASELGVELAWVEADVEHLPFEDGAFDTVTSCFGAMFAPNHRAAADEMLRVCRPGGTIGMLNFTPKGLAGDFFGTLAPYLPPPPPRTVSPLLWGAEDHVRELLGEHVEALEMSHGTYVEQASNPASYCEFFKATFGPVVAIYASLATEPERLQDLDRELLRFAVDSNRGVPGGAAEYEYEYLLVVAQKSAG